MLLSGSSVNRFTVRQRTTRCVRQSRTLEQMMDDKKDAVLEAALGIKALSDDELINRLDALYEAGAMEGRKRLIAATTMDIRARFEPKKKAQGS